MSGVGGAARTVLATFVLSTLGGTLLVDPVRAGAPAVPAQPASVRRAPAPGTQPPALPQPGDSCVGESPTVAAAAPWAQRRMAPQNVWALTRGDGVLVAVVDTGVSAAAGGLSGAVQRGTDVVRAGGADQDCFGRGTALAGIVAARPVTGSPIVGIAPGATVLPVRIVDGKGKIAPGAIAGGIRAATAAGADVILLGVGTSAPDAALRDAVRAAVARDIVLVASVSDAKPTGTGGADLPWYPASDADVLAVGGVGANGAPTEVSPPEASVDLLAPATDAVSVAPRGNGHYSVGGPAVAAAYAAGAAALLRAYHPELHQAEVRRRLELTAEHPLGQWPDPRVGYGTLDLYAALTSLDTRESALPSYPARMVTLPAPAATAPAKLIAGAVAVGAIALAGLGYVSALVIRWGRRRRWRP
ncbi:subtilase family protein [Micromonospora pisi]|uniref:Subtilase family protein n=1 Tax=Micromonospora pisi TaxID=589240 RepID=A0A495JCV1_9ACTN|nr:S8 family serine peptidase [Micromonospora pisi]RKR86745.1 subtilase family protein [Micromonospora pisi]